MTTAYRRDVHKGRRPRHDGTYAQRAHVPHVPGQRCTQCRPLPLSDVQRALLAPGRAVPFRASGMSLETVLDRLEGRRERPYKVAEGARQVFDKAVTGSLRRAQRGRSSRTRSE